jgi:hypothetical protein
MSSNNIYSRKIVGKITATGKSAYESWLDQGNTGTIQDFLSSLGDKTFVYKQQSAASVWTITHNLDKYPSVTVVDTGFTVVYGEIEYLSKNQLQITFKEGGVLLSFSGEAYLN